MSAWQDWPRSSRRTWRKRTAEGRSFAKVRHIFERTLTLFRQVAHSNLRDLPPDFVNVVADDAEQTLARFREILNSFTGEGVENPKQASAAMISAVRDAYEPIYGSSHPSSGRRRASRKSSASESGALRSHSV